MVLTPPLPVKNWRTRFPGHFENAVIEAIDAINKLGAEGDEDLIPVTSKMAFHAAVEAAFNRGAQAIADVVTTLFEKVVLD